MLHLAPSARLIGRALNLRERVQFEPPARPEGPSLLTLAVLGLIAGFAFVSLILAAMH